MGKNRSPIQALVTPFRRIGDNQHEVALFRRADAGYWQVVAGGAEGDETPLEAAKRETFEEASIAASTPFYALKTQASIPRTCFHPTAHWPKDLYIVPGYYFAVDATEAEIRISHEHTEWRWLNFDQAIEMVKWDDDKTAIWELQQLLSAGELGNAL